MSSPSLLIQSDPPLRLLSWGDAAPGVAIPGLTRIGAIRHTADGSEVASVTLEGDNADGALARLLALPPLRAPAILSGPGGETWFTGALTGVTFNGAAATLTLEA